MSDYNITRDAANVITTRYEKMLRNLSEDYQDEMVVVSLMNHYSLCSEPDTDEGVLNGEVDDTILSAIERVLEDYMNTSDYTAWMLTRKGIPYE